MAEDGFKVTMPLMFKSPNTDMSGLELFGFCMRREFKRLFKTQGDEAHARPFTGWLLHLVGHVAAENKGADIGVIGMCLTGGFALAAIAQAPVKAAIACQPAFPFFRSISTLGLSAKERDAVAAGAAELAAPCAKGYRYRNDRICRNSHMRAAQDLLEDRFERYTPDLPGSDHSTLTSNSASEAVYRDVLAFLKARL
jgi:dienelactone hydrolase